MYDRYVPDFQYLQPFHREFKRRMNIRICANYTLNKQIWSPFRVDG